MEINFPKSQMVSALLIFQYQIWNWTEPWNHFEHGAHKYTVIYNSGLPTMKI